MGGLRGEGPPKVDEYGEVVGAEGSEGGPLEISGYFRSGYGEVRGGRVSVGGEAGGCVEVEEDKVSGDKGVENLLPTSRRAGTASLREPRGAVGIEIPRKRVSSWGARR